MTKEIILLITTLCTHTLIKNPSNGHVSASSWVDIRCFEDVVRMNPKTSTEAVDNFRIQKNCWENAEGPYDHDYEKYENCLRNKK